MSDPEASAGLIMLALSAAGLVVVRFRGTGELSGARIALIAALASALALWLGGARLAAIDGGAYRGPLDREVTATGLVAAVPKRSHGEVRVELRTGEGKLLVEAHEPIPDLPVGAELRARGVLAQPEPFLAPLLRRRGIARSLAAEEIELTGRGRGGAAGLLDRIRSRAEAALERGIRDPESALARGFVLGEDDRIDPRTVDDFKRSGLAHHLAVSGENVVLLAVLAMPFLAIAGLSLRARLICVLALIAIYVPVAGAGPSIQRAGVMGAAGIVAALAGRPRSRAYAVILAVFATLAVNPRAGGDIGWQLSFAAVVGIFLWTRRLAALLGAGAAGINGGATRGTSDRKVGRARAACAEGAAMTVAATLATAPLMAHHFDRVSLAALPANLLALPAVAPAMWLGMLSAAAGQVPMPATLGLVEALNAVNQFLLAYIEQVARWFATRSWAVASVRLESPLAVAAAYALLVAGVWLALRGAELRRGLGVGAARGRRRLRIAVAGGLVLALLLAGSPFAGLGGGGAKPEPGELRVSILDVGQGDSILLDPPDGAPVLVDGGPPGDELPELLADHGVSSLASAVVSHDQLDHAAGVLELLGRMPVGSLDYAVAGPRLLGAAQAAGTRPVRLSAGVELSSGSLRLEVLWPPRELLGDRPIDAEQMERAGIDPNRLSLVLLARWRHLSILLPGDAEAAEAPVDPGPVDVLKVAHHGSADPGLAALLDRTVPDLAVISVGAENSYGHPTPETLAALDEHGVPTLRTDEDGTVEIEADADSWSVAASP